MQKMSSCEAKISSQDFLKILKRNVKINMTLKSLGIAVPHKAKRLLESYFTIEKALFIAHKWSSWVF